MAIFDTPRMGWVWGSVAMSDTPLYFQHFWDEHPAHPDELDPVPGSVIIDIESAWYQPTQVTQHIEGVGDQLLELPILGGTYRDIPEGYEEDPGMHACPSYPGWGPGSYQFYCGFIDWDGNPGPLIESTGSPMIIDVGEGEIRGNIYIRPYAHGENWGYAKDAKGIVIYVQKKEPEISEVFPLGIIDFMNGWTKVGDIDSVHYLNSAAPYSPGIPFRYCAGDNDDEQVPGLLSLTGSVGIGYSGPITWGWEDYEGPVDENGDMVWTFTYGEREGQTMSINPAEFVNIMYSRGFNNRSASRETKPFKYYQWPPAYTVEELFDVRLEDIGRQWRWSCATQAKGHVYLGNTAMCEKPNPEPGTSITNPAGIRIHEGDRVRKSGYRNFTNFNPHDFMDVIVNDGDEIVTLESIGDQLMVFRRKSISILNLSEANERVENSFPQGVKAECSVCKTPHGIVFVSNESVYLYDEKSFINLSQRSFTVKKAFEIHSTEDEYNNYKEATTSKKEHTIGTIYTQSVGYYAPNDKIIIMLNVLANNFEGGEFRRDAAYIGGQQIHEFYLNGQGGYMSNSLTAGAHVALQVENTGLTNDCLMYSFKNKAWSYGRNLIKGAYGKSNFVNIGQDLVYYNPEDRKLYKWQEASDGGKSDIIYKTPFFDFGQKNVEKRLKKVYVTLQLKGKSWGLLEGGRELGLQISAAFNGNDNYVPFGITGSKNYFHDVDEGFLQPGEDKDVERHGVKMGYNGDVSDADDNLSCIVELSPSQMTFVDGTISAADREQVYDYINFYSISLKFDSFSYTPESGFNQLDNEGIFANQYSQYLRISDVSISYREKAIK